MPTMCFLDAILKKYHQQTTMHFTAYLNQTFSTKDFFKKSWGKDFTSFFSIQKPLLRILPKQGLRKRTFFCETCFVDTVFCVKHILRRWLQTYFWKISGKNILGQKLHTTSIFFSAFLCGKTRVWYLTGVQNKLWKDPGRAGPHQWLPICIFVNIFCEENPGAKTPKNYFWKIPC